MAKLRLKGLSAANNFLGIEPEFSSFWTSKVVVWPVAYERTTTYIKGTADGPAAILAASPNLETFDEVYWDEPYRQGICTLPIKDSFSENEADALNEIADGARQILTENKLLVTLGGEHSITPPLVRVFHQKYPNLSVLQMDAHADLRESYLGSTNNHACAMARVREMCPHVGVGIRSLSVEEATAIKTEKLNVFFAHERQQPGWEARALDHLTENVYLTIDLDYFDPSLVPGVGTPEPGGGQWTETLTFLEKVFQQKNVVGMDVVELCPIPGDRSSAFIAAKLVHKLIALHFWPGNKK
jgi:agmatinase